MKDKIDYTELRRIIRDLHDYIKHPERLEDYDVAKVIAMASFPHPLLMAEELVRERELRMKAERKAAFFAKEGAINGLKVAFIRNILATWEAQA